MNFIITKNSPSLQHVVKKGSTKLHIATTDEPKKFADEENIEVEVNGVSEAYYNEETLYLYLYDRDYYYTLRAEAKNEVRDVLGGEGNIKEALIEIANSLE